MGFVKMPNKIIYGSKSFVDFYKWVGDDSNWNGGSYIFNVNGEWVMTDSFLKFKFIGDNGLGTLNYAGQEYGGEPCFEGNGWKCYFCPSMGKWILTQNAPWFGYIPKTKVTTYYDVDDGYSYDYDGDLWWEASSVNTTPYGDDDDVGTFEFGIDSSKAADYGLTQYSSITYTLTGDIDNYNVWKHLSGVAPCGTYQGDLYVGYPTWTYTGKNNATHYILKYGSDKWYNLQYVRTRYIDEEYLSTRYTDYVAPEFGMPNLDTERGWYATGSTTPPTPQNNFTLHWFHWVWTDPDDHDQGGSIVQETSWTDDDDVVHPMPDKTVSWERIRGLSELSIANGNVLTAIDMVEAAIWR